MEPFPWRLIRGVKASPRRDGDAIATNESLNEAGTTKKLEATLRKTADASAEMGTETGKFVKELTSCVDMVGEELLFTKLKKEQRLLDPMRKTCFLRDSRNSTQNNSSRQKSCLDRETQR